MPANIRFVEGGDPLTLLKDAWVVIGMNSTAFLAALAMGTIVLSPSYAESVDPAIPPWIADFGQAIGGARTPDELVIRRSEIAHGPPPFVLTKLDLQVINCPIERLATLAAKQASGHWPLSKATPRREKRPTTQQSHEET